MKKIIFVKIKIHLAMDYSGGKGLLDVMVV